jgi:hypothetical protein
MTGSARSPFEPGFSTKRTFCWTSDDGVVSSAGRHADCSGAAFMFVTVVLFVSVCADSVLPGAPHVLEDGSESAAGGVDGSSQAALAPVAADSPVCAGVSAEALDISGIPAAPVPAVRPSAHAEGTAWLGDSCEYSFAVFPAGSVTSDSSIGALRS